MVCAGDRVAIAAYLGKSDRFENAIADFAETCAEQNVRDHAELARAAATGRVIAGPASNDSTVKLGWDDGVFGLLKGLWPAGVAGPSDVPSGHPAPDNSGCCASAPDRVEACDQAAQKGQP
jgi:hypothetical protein